MVGMRIILIYIIFGIFCTNSKAQKHSLNLTSGDRGVTTYPTRSLFDKKYYPALTFGYKIRFVDNKNLSFAQQFLIGYHFHKYIGHNYSLANESELAYKLGKRYFASINLSVGYNLAVLKYKTFQFVNGAYEQRVIYKSLLLTSGALKLGYVLKSMDQIYFGYQYCLSLPYNNMLKCIPMENLLLGFSYCLKRNDTK